VVANGVYLRQGERLVAMAEEPYATEDALQKLLEDYPELLASDARSGEARRWLLISREIGLASDESAVNRWALDHLFVDQDGVPTLVEVKRSSDTRIRREVVGQMLDYAANAVAFWRLDGLQAAFEKSCLRRGTEAEAVLGEFLGSDDDPEAFWARMKANLVAGRLRLVFVADEIPAELRRIVEFLNQQMSVTEVLAVEVKQYVDAHGQHQMIVPRLVGQTEAARLVKGKTGRRQWDRDSILREMGARSATDADVARRVIDWAAGRGDLRLWFGSGQRDGSFQAGLDDASGYLFPFAVWTYGKIEILFETVSRQPPFDQADRRAELQHKLNAIPGIQIADSSLTRRPSFPLATLADEANLQQFTEALDWSFDQARAVGRRRT
jgi:hypothetical protein